MNDLLEIYKLQVEMTDRLSSRRGTMNQYYSGILSALLGLIAILNGIDLIHMDSITNILIGSIGLMICIIWKISIQSYNRLSYSKFKLLSEIEDNLAFQFYKKEWDILKEKKAIKRLQVLKKLYLY